MFFACGSGGPVGGGALRYGATALYHAHVALYPLHTARYPLHTARYRLHTARYPLHAALYHWLWHCTTYCGGILSTRTVPELGNGPRRRRVWAVGRACKFVAP